MERRTRTWVIHLPRFKKFDDFRGGCASRDDRGIFFPDKLFGIP